MAHTNAKIRPPQNEGVWLHGWGCSPILLCNCKRLCHIWDLSPLELTAPCTDSCIGCRKQTNDTFEAQSYALLVIDVQINLDQPDPGYGTLWSHRAVTNRAQPRYIADHVPFRLTTVDLEVGYCVVRHTLFFQSPRVELQTLSPPSPPSPSLSPWRAKSAFADVTS